MSDFVSDIKDFHTKFELQYEGPARELDDEVSLFRIGFIIEELAEYAQNSGYTAIARTLNELHEEIKKNSRWVTRRNEGGRSLEQQFDALIDMAYVVFGTAHLQGFKFNEGWARVQAANMAKVRTENPSDSKRGSKFDVVKPFGWEPADLSDLVK